MKLRSLARAHSTSMIYETNCGRCLASVVLLASTHSRCYIASSRDAAVIDKTSDETDPGGADSGRDTVHFGQFPSCFGLRVGGCCISPPLTSYPVNGVVG